MYAKNCKIVVLLALHWFTNLHITKCFGVIILTFQFAVLWLLFLLQYVDIAETLMCLEKQNQFFLFLRTCHRDAYLLIKLSAGEIYKHWWKLSRHFDLFTEFLSRFMYYSCIQDDEHMWEERPLNRDLLDSAVQDVSYLLDLRVATLRRLMGELMCATHIYLTCVRDATEGRGSRGQVCFDF